MVVKRTTLKIAMKAKQHFITLLFFFIVFFPRNAFAEYVLPYPSEMPGSRLYEISMFIERLSAYWYFGSFGQFKYNLKYSDMYLVQAKTLFEYKQYLLAITALDKSSIYFMKLNKILNSVDKEKIDISEKKKILVDASLKHIEVLDRLKTMLPKTVTWSPENSSTQKLEIHGTIDHAIKVRSEL